MFKFSVIKSLCLFVAFYFLNMQLNFCLAAKDDKFLSNDERKKNEDIINLSDYAYPKLSEVEEDEFLLPILGTNDIHGQAYEKDFINSEISYKVGGYKLLSGLIDIIRKEYKNDILWFDSGDQFTGTIENLDSHGQLMVDFYNAMKVDAVAIGNHEWDQNESQLRKWMQSEMGRFFEEQKKPENLKEKASNFFEENIPLNKTKDYTDLVKENNQTIETEKNELYLAANLKLKSSDKNQEDLPNKIPYQIFKFLDGKIKIGVIGLMTVETAHKTTGFPNDEFIITSYVEAIKRQALILREKGATAVLALTHVGLTCKDPKWDETLMNEYYKLGLRDKDTKQVMTCKGEMFDLLNKLSTDVLDGVISGHVHESIHHFINDIPVIQNPMSNIFANIMYLRFKKNENGNYKLLKQNTLIEGPIPLCNKIYTNNLRCNIYQDITEENKIKISDFTFHNGVFTSDEKVEKVFSSYKSLEEKINKMKAKKIFLTDVHLERNANLENYLGNLISDIYKILTKSHVGFLSAGNLRYIWEKGQVSEYEFKNMFPFGGNFSRYNVTGKNLKKIVETLQTGENKFYSFSGLRMNITFYNSSLTKVDMDNLSFENGDKIKEEEIYSIASNDFMLNGGDDMSKFKVDGIMTINSTAIENSLDIIENFENYLIKLGRLTKEKADELLGKVNIEYK